MTRDEYEGHKQRLAAELRNGVEMLHASYQAQMRALELVWMMSGGTPSLGWGEAAPPAWRALGTGEEAPPAEAPPPEALPPAPPARKPRRGPGELRADLLVALAQVPETFSGRDLCRALGYQPNRGSFSRTMYELCKDGWLEVQHHGAGRDPSTYRKLRPAPGGTAGS